MGVELFRRSGRRKVLRDAGHLVFGYADEIFSLGREFVATVNNQVGVADSFPELLTNTILAPVPERPRDLVALHRQEHADFLPSDQHLACLTDKTRAGISLCRTTPIKRESINPRSPALRRCLMWRDALRRVLMV
jgi:DNA-binding transcriptional LysR family regulator